MTDPVPSLEGEVDDGVFVHRVAEGSSDALGALYDRYGRPAYALAARITGDPELAEDVVHGVFVDLWRDPARYDPRRGGFPGWLLAATHHAALEATRQVGTARRCREELAAQTAGGAGGAQPGTAGGAGGAQPGTAGGAGGAGGAQAGTAAGDRGDRARQALAALPAAQREALILAYFAGHTQQEIAADTGAPIETVRSRMVRGMRELRVLLDDGATPEVRP
jgi:RNA polymerase sigma factor (sigma-70 family)